MLFSLKRPLAQSDLRSISLLQLDGVGPVDNGPSPAMLHHFVRKKEIKISINKNTLPSKDKEKHIVFVQKKKKKKKHVT